MKDIKNDILSVDNVLDKSLKGWLPVRDNTNNSFYIPYLTKLKIEDNGFYQILEGDHKGQLIKIDDNKIKPRFYSTYLNKYFNFEKGLNLTLDLNRQELIINSSPEYKYSVSALNIKKGEYQILIPDKPHNNKTKHDYYNEELYGSRFASTWFPIKANNCSNQYLHLGTFSEGCITVLIDYNNDWKSLYFHLLKSRKSLGVIGLLTVI